jgi:hypothetical protein
MHARGHDAERGLDQALWLLKAFLPHLVLIGGWVPHLYRRYGGFREWSADLSRTFELDLLVSLPLERVAGDTIPAALRRAHFESRAAGAVWEGGKPRVRIEFMAAHRGTALERNQVVAVDGHEGFAALALDGLSLLRDFSTVLSVPVGRIDNAAQTVEVRVPTLGAYVVNKAITFPYRPAEIGEASPKRAKDILYLRDLMAAGEEVILRIEADLAELVKAGCAGELKHAAANTYLLLHGAMHRYLVEAAAVLAERERMAGGTAEADMAGRLTDLHELLAGSIPAV